MVFRLTLAVLCLALWGHAARAVPSFAAQTGQPCAACHVGAFGPQLRAFGRDFKLGGYTASDGGKHGLPIAGTVQASFTHTQSPEPPARWFAPNDNPALDQISLYYAGAISRHIGGFVQITYDGVARQLHIDNADLRYAREKEIFGKDSVWGVTLNNSPTVTDLWNSTPVWGFPYNLSPLAATPAAATRIDGAFAQSVLGLGGYIMWNDWVYAEADLYRGLGRDVRNATGIVPVAGTDSVVDTAPYWRLALTHDWGKRVNWEIGTYGIAADVLPGGLSPSGRADRFTDVAADANWQFTLSPRRITSDILSFHATIIGEAQDRAASALLADASRHGNLTTMRADLSYAIAATYIPTIQLFRTSGSTDAAYWQQPGGNPGSAGAIAELAYVPFGKPDSPIAWGNLRFALQYIAYTEFDGQRSHASDQNTLYLSAWAAWHF